MVLPLPAIQNAPSDRVATAMLQAIFPGYGPVIMAIFIMISTFGCVNSLVLAGARAYYAMAKDGLFFKQAGTLNQARVPGWSLVVQGIWSAMLVLPRTYDVATKQYGNLYSNLLDYVISAALLFYILTIAGVFQLRRKRPDLAASLQGGGIPVRAGALHYRRVGSAVHAVRVPALHHVARPDYRDHRRGSLRLRPQGRGGTRVVDRVTAKSSHALY